MVCFGLEHTHVPHEGLFALVLELESIFGRLWSHVRANLCLVGFVHFFKGVNAWSSPWRICPSWSIFGFEEFYRVYIDVNATDASLLLGLLTIFGWHVWESTFGNACLLISKYILTECLDCCQINAIRCRVIATFPRSGYNKESDKY